MRILIALLTIAFVLALVSLALLNAQQEVRISLGEGFTRPARPVHLSWVIVGSTLAGVVFMGVVSVLEGLHLRLANGRLRRQAQRLQQEVDELRSLPLREAAASPAPSAGPPGPDGPGSEADARA